MRVISYVCDVCERPIQAGQVQLLLVNGIEQHLDPTCLKTTRAVFGNKTAWESERGKVEAAEAQVGKDELAVEPAAEPIEG